MPNYYEDYQGQCSICRKKTSVRHKPAIQLIGSEGTDMCWACERHMLKYLQERQMKFHRERVEQVKRGKRSCTL